MKKTVRVKKERHFKPHAEFYHAASVHLEHVRAKQVGYFYSALSGLMMTAFAFEAYMNYVGPKVEAGWEDFDRASTLGKFRHIAGVIGYPLDFSKPPHQSVKALFGFRNRMAHPRDERLVEEYLSTPESYTKDFYSRLSPQWMSFVEEGSAKRCHRDVGEIMIAINHLLPTPDISPLMIDGGAGSASPA